MIRFCSSLLEVIFLPVKLWRQKIRDRKIARLEQRVGEIEALVCAFSQLNRASRLDPGLMGKIDWPAWKRKIAQFLMQSPQDGEKRTVWIIVGIAVVLGVGLLIYGSIVWHAGSFLRFFGAFWVALLFFGVAYLILGVQIDRRSGYYPIWLWGIALYAGGVYYSLCCVAPAASPSVAYRVLDRKIEVRETMTLRPWEHRIEDFDMYPVASGQIEAATKCGEKLKVRYKVGFSVSNFYFNWPEYLASCDDSLGNPLDRDADRFAQAIVRQEISRLSSLEIGKKLIAGVNSGNLFQINTADYPMYKRTLASGVELMAIGDLKLTIDPPNGSQIVAAK